MGKYNSNSNVPSSAGSNVFAKTCRDPELEVGVGKQMESLGGPRGQSLLGFQKTFENSGSNVIVARADSVRNEDTGFEWTGD